MEEIKIKVAVREDRGTAHAKSLRRQDLIPAVVYGKGLNLALTIEKKELKYLRQHHFSENVILNLEIADKKGSKKVPTLLKDYQLNPLTDEVLHLDFIRVSMTEKVEVEVPVEIKGEPKGVKEGGSLERVLWNIRVKCLPKDIPKNITIDVADLDIGDSIHVSDLGLPSGVEFVSEATEVVVTVAAPVKEEEIVEAAEAPAEEPEVIKEKPKEKEEAAPAGGEKPKDKDKDKEKKQKEK
jgi:large subunit ribosomal protein L25